jgi:hypothetical protein
MLVTWIVLVGLVWPNQDNSYPLSTVIGFIVSLFSITFFIISLRKKEAVSKVLTSIFIIMNFVFWLGILLYVALRNIPGGLS